MVASVIAWLITVVFATAGLEKLLRADARRRFFATVRDHLAPPLAIALGVGFIAGELAVAPLLAWRPGQGLRLLVLLTLAVTGYAFVRWRRGAEGECGCGGLWAATGANLLRRNLLLLAGAIFAWLTAPTPLVPAAPWYALGLLLLLLLVGGIVEAVRIHRHAG